MRAPSEAREVSPPAHRRWRELQQGQKQYAEALFPAWLDRVAHAEALFRVHLYGKKDATAFDYRQHRALLFTLLSEGEELAILFLSLKTGEDVGGYISVIDSKVADLFKTLLEWHMPSDFVDPIPDDFKRAIDEAERGKVVDMEKALKDPPM